MDESHAPRILVVANEPTTAEQLRHVLADRFPVDRVEVLTPRAARHLDLGGHDLVVADLDLPDDQGFALIEHLHHRRRDLPILAVTAGDSPDGAARAIRAGACDCLARVGGDGPALARTVEKMLATSEARRQDRRRQQELEQTLQALSARNRQLEEVIDHLEQQALTDPLTGLANRRHIRDTLERSFSESARYGTDLAVLMIDIDGFKQLNDTHGHQSGDQLLETAAKVLTTQCRRCDIAGRYGGDEFLVLLPHAPPEVAEQVARRIMEHFRAAAADLAPDLPDLHLSIGVACMSLSFPASAQQLVAHSDTALYRAKAGGKARICVHRPPQAQVTCRPDTLQARDGREGAVASARG